MIFGYNVFTEENLKKEIEFYGLKTNYKKNTVRIGVGDSGPVLVINNIAWASMEPFEILSYLLPIKLAKGKIATAGLGLGYYVLKVIDKEEVTSIDVYELNIDVINFFNTTFKNRKGFEKVTIIQGDAKETFKNKEYDFAFIDIYQNWYSEDIIEDVNFFSQNNIKQLYMWSQDTILVYAFKKYEIPVTLTQDEKEFSEMYEFKENMMGPSKEYCEKFLKAIKRL